VFFLAQVRAMRMQKPTAEKQAYSLLCYDERGGT
jgi:hypothetical protein